jgi:hypothetical protein
MPKYRVAIINDAEEYKQEILKLWGGEDSLLNERRFNWLYKENPVGKTLLCLAFLGSTNEVIGCGSVYLRNVKIHGKIYLMGFAIDFAVREEHRVLGPALTIVKTLISEINKMDIAFAFVYPNKVASAVFKRAGYEDLGVSRDYYKIISFKNQISKIIKIGWLGRAVSFIFDTLSSMYSLRYRLPKGLKVAVLDATDEHFDRLWESIHSGYVITEERSSSFLTWRFRGEKDKKSCFYCLFENGTDRLLSFITYTLDHKNREAVIKDIFPSFGNKHLMALLSDFTRKMRAEGMDFISVSYFGNEKIVKSLKKLLFIESKVMRNYLIYVPEKYGNELNNVIHKKENYIFYYG